MKWSWRIGTIAGIGVFMHFTFLLLLGWVALSHFLQRGSLRDAVDGLIFILVLFGIVVLHELGHALTARRFGIQTRDITLLPIGGVARLERMPEDPRQELLVALAGPAVNFALAAVLFAILVPLQATVDLESASLVGGNFVVKLLLINLVLGTFNLIPAFPMDGGRVLRALLATRLDYVRATEIAASVGQFLAFVFGFIGLFTNPFLVFIALFVWMGATQEASMVMAKSALRGIPIGHMMITDFRVLESSDPLSAAVSLLLAVSQQDFPVMERGALVGVLTRSDLLAGLAQRGDAIPVAEVMKRDFKTAEPSELAQTVFERLQGCECHTLPVIRNGEIVGLVTTENLGEFFMVSQALRKAN